MSTANLDILVVGGGAGSGMAGGGGGGVVWHPSRPMTVGSYSVTIGAGGARGIYAGAPGQPGGTTSFDSGAIQAYGGGLGDVLYGSSHAGGSSSGWPPDPSGVSPPAASTKGYDASGLGTLYGNPGGSNGTNVLPYPSGGGGGAGSPGEDGGVTGVGVSGDGGDGIEFFGAYYGAGGGGSIFNVTSGSGAPPQGKGGKSGIGGDGNGTNHGGNSSTYDFSHLNTDKDGLSGYGGGGGGGDYYNYVGGNGGSGTVVIRSSKLNQTITATGGTYSFDSIYDYWTFTADGTFAISSITLTSHPVDVLVVGGGGGGGSGSGGGAGQIALATAYAITIGAYACTIGAGGNAGGASGAGGGQGSNSDFDSVIVGLGGGNGAGFTGNGSVGGSGSGAGAANTSTSGGGASVLGGGGGSVIYGHHGGSNGGFNTGSQPGGGGGGAGAVGSDASSTSQGGGGGAGLSVFGTTYAGGGGGGVYSGAGTSGSGGSGGGGNAYGVGGQISGVANSGGGGGAGDITHNGGTGGSGVIVVRSLKSIQSITATGGTHTADASYDYWTFTSTDTFTITDIGPGAASEMFGASDGSSSTTGTLSENIALFGSSNASATADGHLVYTTGLMHGQSAGNSSATGILVNPSDVEVLVVGGGGGGVSGGGGAGQIQYHSKFIINPGTYSVVIGSGGTGANATTSSPSTVNAGGDSSFDAINAIGGGYGGNVNSSQIGVPSGGAGGGGLGGTVAAPGNTTGSHGATAYSNAGGVNDNAPPYNGSGGGGAGLNGGFGGSNNPQPGGAGLPFFNGAGGISYYAAGGGGGNASTTGQSISLGGSGIGGNGGNGVSAPTAGAANTGSGGGGGFTLDGFTGGFGADGGSGVVVIRSPKALNSIVSTGGIHTSDATYDYWVFTSSGSWVVTRASAPGNIDLIGNSNGSSTATGALSKNSALFGTSNGSSSSTGTLTSSVNPSLRKVVLLSTVEASFGIRQLGQTVLLPSGRINKISLYLEPTISDKSIADGILVVCDIYAVNSFGFPTGVPLSSDSRALSSITIPGYVNFRVSANASIVVAVLRLEGADSFNFVSWRYAGASAGNEELLISSDAGITWNQDPTRKFAYIAYSDVPDAVDYEDQSVLIQPGTMMSVVDSTGAAWNQAVLQRTSIVGDSVKIDFSNMNVSLIVDQSGSMTWNDNRGLRFDFMNGMIDNLDSALASFSPGTDIKYSIYKFGGRKIGKITIDVDGSDNKGFDFIGVRIVRNATSIPTGPTDGLVVYEGANEWLVDQVPSSGQYYYGVFAVNSAGIYSAGRKDRCRTAFPAIMPMGVANVGINELVVLSSGNDLGTRRIVLTWSNPSGYDYSVITLVRNEERIPESPLDGDILLFQSSPTTITYTDSDVITDMTYNYAIFTENSSGIKCSATNSRGVSVHTKPLDRTWENQETVTAPIGLDTTIPLPPTVTVLDGNAEIQLDWVPETTTSGDVKRYRLWSRNDGYPEIVDAFGRQYDGNLLYDGSGTEFIHRALDNGQEYFYVLVSIDAVGNTSVATKFNGKPSATSTASIPPETVSAFEAEVIDASTVSVAWANPNKNQTNAQLYFGQTARVVSSVEFVDSGDLGTFVTYQFVVSAKQVVETDDPVSSGLTPISPDDVIILASSPSLGTDTITATISMTSNSDLLNRLSSASFTIQAVLSVVNRVSGAVLATVKSTEVAITFSNPFSLSILNDPVQMINRREWKALDGGDSCQEFEYVANSLPGIYAGTLEPFKAVIEAKFDGKAIIGTSSVSLALLDPTTLKPSGLVSLPNGATTYTITHEIDEILDRNGAPTGNFSDRSLIRLDLPPSDVPGDFILQATASYNGYVQTAQMTIHYEPTLNVDLDLRAFTPDGVDVAEQKAFVYFGPWEAPQSEKIAVPDFTITNWSIRPTCIGGTNRPLYGGDAKGLGLNAYTHGGLAQGVFWGPYNNLHSEEVFEVQVSVQVGGMKATGYGMLSLQKIQSLSMNRILLRNPTGFYADMIEADGTATSRWEVVAKPESENSDDLSSGNTFVDRVLGAGGLVPSLPDGRVVTLAVQPLTVEGPNGSVTQNSLAGFDVLKNLVIKTNLTGNSGVSGTASAMIENGKAIFDISVNGKVPKPDDLSVQSDFVQNVVYNVQFEKPNTGIVLFLTAYTVVEVNGAAVAFKGGGSDVVNDAPPAFIGLLEPLQPT